MNINDIKSFIYDNEPVKLHYHNGKLIWAKPYTISYNANGGSGAPASQTKRHGTDLILSSAKPTKPTSTNYTFLGWGTSSDDTSVDYSPGATYSKDEDANLYAVWCKHTSTLTKWLANCRYYSYCTTQGCTWTSSTSQANHGPYEVISYTPYSETQHTVTRHCTYKNNCNYVEDIKEAHSFGSWGSWSSSSSTQHSRTRTCSQCGYKETESESHNYVAGSWSNYSSSQHSRTMTCTVCGHTIMEYGKHDDSGGSFTGGIKVCSICKGTYY